MRRHPRDDGAGADSKPVRQALAEFCQALQIDFTACGVCASPGTAALRFDRIIIGIGGSIHESTRDGWRCILERSYVC